MSALKKLAVTVTVAPDAVEWANASAEVRATYEASLPDYLAVLQSRLATRISTLELVTTGIGARP